MERRLELKQPIQFCNDSTEILAILKETYRKPDLSWVDEFADALYSSPDSPVEDNFNVILEIGPKSSTRLVTGGAYDRNSGRYTIVISPMLSDLIDEGQRKDDFIVELKRLITHEDTHRQQNQLNYAKQSYYVPNDMDDPEQFKKYATQWQERDAFAREVAYTLSETLDKNEIIKALELDAPLIAENGLKQDVDCFRDSGAVWHMFLNNVYRYFEEPFIGGGKSDLRKWLHDAN